MALSVYRELLRAPSFTWLLGTSVVGRLNQGMMGLAVLMIVTEHSNYAVAGLVSTSGVVGAFIAGPLLSRWADTYGRRRVLLATAVLNSGALVAIVLAPPRPVLLACLSLLSGLTTPPTAAAVRAVLPELVDKDRRRSVFALESTLQELVFVLGPPATALLTAFAGARFAVIVCAVLVLLGVLGYVRDPKVEIGRKTGTRGARRPVLGIPGIPRLVVVGALLFGALGCQAIGVIAMVSGSQVSSSAGFVVACGSLGSLVGGLVYGSLTRDRAALRHLLLLFTAGLSLLLLTGRPVVLTFLLFVWGLTIAPAMSRLFERLSILAPPESTTEVFGWTNSATAGGNALATAVSGFVVSAYGARASLVMGCALGLIAALVCEPWPRLARRRDAGATASAAVMKHPARAEGRE